MDLNMDRPLTSIVPTKLMLRSFVNVVAHPYHSILVIISRNAHRRVAKRGIFSNLQHRARQRVPRASSDRISNRPNSPCDLIEIESEGLRIAGNSTWNSALSTWLALTRPASSGRSSDETNVDSFLRL
ncbi:hypothetical protein HN011_011221 [Eciton burchellii]|nr:hypothetical protein HN011_011221 [Eciton burchellii]